MPGRRGILSTHHHHHYLAIIPLSLLCITLIAITTDYHLLVSGASQAAAAAKSTPHHQSNPPHPAGAPPARVHSLYAREQLPPPRWGAKLAIDDGGNDGGGGGGELMSDDGSLPPMMVVGDGGGGVPVAGGYYYEEPARGGAEELGEAMAMAAAVAGNYPPPTIIGLDDDAEGQMFPQQTELDNEVDGGSEPMLAQDFSDMPAVVADDSTTTEAGYFELPPNIGQTSGLAVDAQQNLVIFHRSSREWDQWSFDAKSNRFNRTLGPIPNATIAILDPSSGRLLAEHGAGAFYMPHGMSIDAEGNVWVTDVGRHQVLKLDKSSLKPLLEVGERMVPGGDEKHFCMPTDVAVARSGEFFVADGYCNARVMKFDREGKFVTSFGQPNSANPPHIGEFFIPHSLVLIEDLNVLCVADRENERIQCFAAGLNDEGSAAHHPRAYIPTGTFFTKAEHIGRVYAIREKQHYLVGVTSRDEKRQVAPQVFVMDMNTGRANTFAKGLENAHALALSDHGDIYVAQMNPNQIVKFSVPQDDPTPPPPTTATARDE
jgi:peptidylamidoglycolate lyase